MHNKISSCFKVIVIGFCLFFVAGCATMNESDCLAADWEQIGYRDGSRGMTTSILDSRARACTEFGVTLDRSSYMSGRNNGLADFCTPDQGYAQAQAREEYNYVCPTVLESPFLKSYIKGLNETLDTLDFDSRDLELDIREAEQDRREAATLEDRESADKRINFLNTRIDGMNEEAREIRGWLNRAIDAL